jgi:hypothetical protein
MCISYDRVLEISTQLGASVVSTFLEEDVVCPAVAQKDISTTSAVDSMDHNRSATTTTTSFNGTGRHIGIPAPNQWSRSGKTQHRLSS